MLCPMKFHGEKFVSKDIEREYWECEKEQCAWWKDNYNKCAIKDIAESLSLIINQGLDVNNYY